MKRSKQTKKALTGSVLALVLCFVMLLGTTFAWFTDTASTKVNTIQAGTLDVALEKWEGEKWVGIDENETLSFVKAAGHEDEDILWEPGATYMLPKLHIVNKGDLALEYKVVITAAVGDGNLAEVLELHAVAEDGTTALVDPKTNAILTLDDALTSIDKDGFAHGNLAGGETSVDLAFALHMQETAGNEYQGLSISGITVAVYAKQDTVEYDSYDNTYDAAATYDEPWSGRADMTWYDENKTEFSITTAEELAGFAQLVNNGTDFNGKTVILGADINLGGRMWTPIGKNATDAPTFKGTFDGNGYTISNLNVNVTTQGVKGAGFFGCVYCGTVKNLTIANATVKGYSHVAALVGSSMCATIDNCHVVNATATANTWLSSNSYDDGDKVGGIVGYFACEPNGSVTNCSVKNSTIVGYRDLGALIGYFNTYKDNCTAVINNNAVSNVTIYQDNTNNYKNYTPESDYHVKELIGYEAKSLGGSNTVNGVTVKMSTATSSDVDTIDAALNSDTNVDMTDNVTADAKTTKAQGYGSAAAGLAVNDTTLDGGNKTLTVTNANGTWDCAIITSGGTIKNLTITGAFRGIFTGGLTSDLYVENVTIDGTTYTFSSDGSGDYNVSFTNCTLNGWTSYTSGFKSVSFTNCSFGEGNDYAYCRPYSNTTFTNCTFESGFEFDSKQATSTFVNCYVGETLITTNNVTTLLGSDAGNVVINNT